MPIAQTCSSWRLLVRRTLHQDFATFPLVDWQAAGMLKQSFAKPVLTTLEQALVIRRMGNLTPRDLDSLRQMLTQIFG